MTTLKTASVLAFERKLTNSDALMYAGNWQDRTVAGKWQPVKLQQKDVRGTISNRLKNAVASDPAKLDAEIQKANLQTVDVAALPFNADTLKVHFTLRVLGNLATPTTCNDPDYQQALSDIINGYIEQNQFTELANRYAQNLANGRFLWRNRIGLEQLEVRIKCRNAEGVESNWIFNGHDYDMRQFTQPQGDLKALSEAIRKGLIGDDFMFFSIAAFALLGEGQEVFPSQELVLDSGKDNKSKYLYEVDNVAAMHSQKIGNALRTIDTWHPAADEVGAIAVEPYGAVTNRGKAYRQPKPKDDFYSLLDAWVLKGNVPPVDQQHYVIATLIRGGVFGEAG